MDPVEFERGFSVLRAQRQAAREKRKLIFGTAKMSEYVESQEKREQEFMFDYDEMIKELEKR